jgi:hypothetical protein
MLFELPVGKFASGLHLLTVEATSGSLSASRNLRFETAF